MTKGREKSMGRLRRLSLLAIAVGLLVLGLKYLAFRVTGSVSLYSDALESIVNTVAAVGVFFALRLAVRPPDREHPFGHSKAEYFSAVLEGAFILFAAVEIVRAGWSRIGEPIVLVRLNLGIGLAILATLINASVAAVLVRAGRKYRSPALHADGRHLWADVMTTVSVLAGIGIASATGLWILDPLLALAVAGHILWVGVGVVKDSVGGLMDRSLPEREMRQIRSVIASNMGVALEVHDLRSRTGGGRSFVEFHLVVPGHLSVADSHDLCDNLEQAIDEILPTASVLIHVEPEAQAKKTGKVAQVGEERS